MRGRSICRDDLLNREKTLQEKIHIAFDLTYYPIFKNVRKILEELHLLLTPDQAHKIFSEVSVIGFGNSKSLRDHLVRTALTQFDREGRSKRSEGPNCSCEVCESGETFDFFKGPLDCNCKNVIYLFECRKCQFKLPYVRKGVTKFRFRFNNYKSTHRKFRKKLKEVANCSRN